MSKEILIPHLSRVGVGGSGVGWRLEELGVCVSGGVFLEVDTEAEFGMQEVYWINTCKNGWKQRWTEGKIFIAGLTNFSQFDEQLWSEHYLTVVLYQTKVAKHLCHHLAWAPSTGIQWQRQGQPENGGTGGDSYCVHWNLMTQNKNVTKNYSLPLYKIIFY